MEGDEGLRTVDCLRGRLLAERAASKAANHQSQLISKKIIELEKQLKMEIKSRNKAEKRLKFLMKKLESLSISEKSEILSVTSFKSQPQIELQKTQFSNISKCVTDTYVSRERHNCPSHDDNLRSLDEAISENSSEKEDNTGSKSLVTQKDNDNEEHDQDTFHTVDNSMALIMFEEKTISTPTNNEEDDDVYDNSMALVVVDSIVTEKKKDVLISNSNIKDVLDALRYARECLKTTMDTRRHMKSSIAYPRPDRISC